VNRFFDELGGRWADAASRRGTEIEPPALDPEMAAELLELARVAAHTQERRFAPLAAFTAGVAAERLRIAASASPAQLAEFVREVRQQLEEQSPPQLEAQPPPP